MKKNTNLTRGIRSFSKTRQNFCKKTRQNSAKTCALPAMQVKRGLQLASALRRNAGCSVARSAHKERCRCEPAVQRFASDSRKRKKTKSKRRATRKKLPHAKSEQREKGGENERNVSVKRGSESMGSSLEMTVLNVRQVGAMFP